MSKRKVIPSADSDYSQYRETKIQLIRAKYNLIDSDKELVNGLITVLDCLLGEFKNNNYQAHLAMNSILNIATTFQVKPDLAVIGIKNFFRNYDYEFCSAFVPAMDIDVTQLVGKSGCLWGCWSIFGGSF